MEKLSILVALANDKNVEQLLLELKEYASECVSWRDGGTRRRARHPRRSLLAAHPRAAHAHAVLLPLPIPTSFLSPRVCVCRVDVEYVRRAVRTIGRCAIKLESAAEKCIKVLLALIQTKVNYVVQEAVVVIKDIFRRYPNRYESIIAILCSCLDTLDEPEAKASMIWIIGEYADRIDNAG